jgi:hypothetical protein
MLVMAALSPPAASVTAITAVQQLVAMPSLPPPSKYQDKIIVNINRIIADSNANLVEDAVYRELSGWGTRKRDVLAVCATQGYPVEYNRSVTKMNDHEYDVLCRAIAAEVFRMHHHNV